MSDASAAVRPGNARLALLRCFCAALLVALDLFSKRWVFAWMGELPAGVRHDEHGHLRYPLAGEWLSFMLSYNQGMAWGLSIPPYVLIGARGLAVLFLIYLVARAPRAERASSAALVLILAGAAGNLYDNLFEPPREAGHPFGAVRDFIDVYFARWDYHFPTFNVADSCITVGAVLLFVASLRGSPRHAP